ncbi:MAG: endonuclease [Draconibacterium sp.]|nr:MAG: endonuclease [Draconibacterium sp.]
MLLAIACNQQKMSNDKTLTVAFYNTENLFDIFDDKHTDDKEFTPDGRNNWTIDRYTKKIDDIAKVLSNINKRELPEIIGLCEIENKKVLDDLVHSKYLKAGNYRIVHYDSRDNRGIDCALIFRPDEFNLKKSTALLVPFPEEPGFVSRDILYVTGETNNGETLHIFVNHWPSRNKGVKNTELRRVQAARFLKSKVDKILRKNSSAEIIIMGDMNDEPSNRSLLEILQANRPGTPDSKLVNLMYPVHDNHRGSYNFRGNWNMLDNIITTPNLLNNEGFQCKEGHGYIFRKPWMEYVKNNGDVTPNRTYGGPNYYGGISDHFPVYAEFERE